VRGRVLKELSQRVQNGSILFPPEVLGELGRRDDEAYKWAHENEAEATRFGRLYEEAKEVLGKVPDLVDPNKVAVGGVDEGDPYVIALAVKLKREGHEVTIITEDYSQKPNRTALADAAGVFGIPCVRFRTYLKQEGIWDGVEGK